jgi:hypothetical protein
VTLYDLEDLVAGLERGAVSARVAESTTGPFYSLFSRPQIVRAVADRVYCYLDGRRWHPECAAVVLDLLARCDRLGDAPLRG